MFMHNYYKTILQEPTNIITRYNDKDDNLYMILYNKIPQGRVLRKKWTNEWRNLPNLENWI